MSFTVTRMAESFVTPAEPTPNETLALTAIDRVPGLHHAVLSLHVFDHGVEPARVIREALSRALVSYYPLAGRFLDPDSPDGEVSLACTGEGAWFVEAVAGCTLDEVKRLEQPLMISREDLLPDPRPALDPLSLPLMMQVTEFTCGGFVVGIVSVHTLTDGLGFAQFMLAVGELARGLLRPTVEPVWRRELIPSPPKLPLGPAPAFPTYKLRSATADVPFNHINKIKAQYFELTGQRCSTFDVAAATVWQSRTRAIKLALVDADVQLCFFANARQLLPAMGGYCGNCFFPVKVTAAASRIAAAELVEVVRVIRDGKARLPEEFSAWAAGKLGCDPYALNFGYESLFLSDWTRLGFFEVDYGWGTPAHIVPFAYYDFMAVAIISAPPAPAKGARVTTQCVKEEHLKALHQELANWRKKNESDQ